MSARLPTEIVAAITGAVMERGGRVERHEVRFRCPAHDDEHPSARWHPTEHVWRCDVCRAGGGALDLAKRLAIPLPNRRSHAPSLPDFAAARCLSLAILQAFKVQATVHKGRPALRYPTPVGPDRVKYLDEKRPKYTWAARGGRAHWYGLEQSVALLRAGARVLYIVNGEPSVWACASRGVPAVALAGGEGTRFSPGLLEELQAGIAGLGTVAIRVVYDTDRAGLVGARDRVSELRAKGILDVAALDLRSQLPGVAGADVDDLQRHVGEQLAVVLTRLPVLEDEARRASSPPDGRPLDELLCAVENLVTRHVILPSPSVVAIVLWVAHAHAFDAFEQTPYLAASSPEKRCGKTRLLEVLEGIVPRPWRAAGVSPAVLFRKIARDRSTLLLDEIDAIFRKPSDTTEALRSLLNAGNRRGSVVSRADGKGERLVDFDVFCPKVLAGIGALPDTIADRAIPVRLARRKKSEAVTAFRLRYFTPQAQPLREAMEAWGRRAVEALRCAEPSVPEQLHDRAADAWEPLLAIADLAGGDWPKRARAAALALHEIEPSADGVGGTLLRAIAEIFAARGPRLLTRDLLAALVEREHEPWGSWWGVGIDKGDIRGPGYRLAKLLRPYGIGSKSIRVGDERAQGFERSDFDDVFSRYVNDLTTRQAASGAAFRAHEGPDTSPPVRSPNGGQTLGAQGLSRRQVVEGGETVEERLLQTGTDPIDPWGERPSRACSACGAMDWWPQPGGAWVCGTCHPPPRRPEAVR